MPEAISVSRELTRPRASTAPPRGSRRWWILGIVEELSIVDTDAVAALA